MKKYLGVYEFGYNYVDVYVTDRRAGFFMVLPGDGKRDKIEIGLDYRRWRNCASILLHETFEYCSCVLGNRFTRDCRVANGTDQYIFMFDHNQFSEICAWQGDGLQFLYNDIYKEWKELNKKKNKKVKRIK